LYIPSSSRPVSVVSSKSHSIATLSSHSSTAPNSLKSRTTALNDVVANRADSDAPPSKSKSKHASTTLRKPEIAKDAKDDEAELSAIGGLGDEDDTQEREAALCSPIKGKDSRQLAKVSIFCHSNPF